MTSQKNISYEQKYLKFFVFTRPFPRDLHQYNDICRKYFH